MTAQLIVALVAAVAAPIASIIVVIVNQRKLKLETDKQQTEVLLLCLRSTIQGIYAMYKQDGKIPVEVYRGMCEMYDRYVSKGGNSYLHALKNEMDSWRKG